MQNNNLYKQRLFTYFKDTRFSTPQRDVRPSIHYGKLCSDKLEMFLKLEQDEILQVNFVVTGCIVATACAAMLAEFCQNKPIYGIQQLTETEFISNIIQITIDGPRKDCATLAFKSLKQQLTTK